LRPGEDSGITYVEALAAKLSKTNCALPARSRCAGAAIEEKIFLEHHTDLTAQRRSHAGSVCAISMPSIEI
jgi:hypothetical protein